MTGGARARSRRAGLALIAALAALIAACAAAPQCPTLPATPPGPPYLWRVQRGDGPVVWLYGTVHHAGTASVAPAVWAALDRAPRLVTELGDAAPDPDRFRELARLPYGQPGLEVQLGADDWWDLRDVLAPVIKDGELRRLRPWYAMSLLTRHLAPSASPTMDAALVARAHDRGLPVEALETWDQQLPLLADAVGTADLREALHTRATMRCDLDDLRQRYDAGDLAAMHIRLNVDGSARLLTERNQRWLIAIEAWLTTGGAFVAVGLSHLSGDGGLPHLLAIRGYDVQRAGD